MESLSLSWRDEHGLVHVMADNLESEYDPPYTLISMCGWTHHHDHSKEIRRIACTDPPTCLECVVAQHPEQPDYDVSWARYASCCS